MTDEQIIEIRKGQSGRYGSGVVLPYGDSIQFARAVEAFLLAQWQAAIAEQPVHAYAVYFPDQPCEELVHNLDDLLDDITNREHTITNLYALPPKAEPLEITSTLNFEGKHHRVVVHEYEPAPQGVQDIATEICNAVAELPDRNSPEDWPEAMLVTHDELRLIVEQALDTEPSKPVQDHIDTPINMVATKQAEAPTASNEREAWADRINDLVDEFGAETETQTYHGGHFCRRSPTVIREEIRAALATQQEAQPQAEPQAFGDLTGVQVCCGEYAQCHRPCTPRGRWLAQAEPAGGDKEAAEDVIVYSRALVNFYRERGEFLPVQIENLGESLDDLDAARAAQQATGERG